MQIRDAQPRSQASRGISVTMNNTVYAHFAGERVIVFISFSKGSGTLKQLRAIPAQVKGPKLSKLNYLWLVSLHFLPLAKAIIT